MLVVSRFIAGSVRPRGDLDDDEYRRLIDEDVEWSDRILAADGALEDVEGELSYASEEMVDLQRQLQALIEEIRGIERRQDGVRQRFDRVWSDYQLWFRSVPREYGFDGLELSDMNSEYARLR